ncbi:MAG: hypothetical protein ACRDPS_10170 [Nocardioides sp.]|uniref:hypothetical protein n=1 Tax=Nocardioides sp. TaxID=35761 RepID=UPI003D6B67B5
MDRDRDGWRGVAGRQGGVVTRAQLRDLGVSRWFVRNQVVAERWVARSPTAISTFTGVMTREQRMWLGVLQGGPRALVGGMTAMEVHGLANWHRDTITVLVPYGDDIQEPIDGIDFVRTRKAIDSFGSPSSELPLMRVEPAALLWAARERSDRTSQGILAAVVQQRLTTPEALTSWLRSLKPLRKAPLFRQALADMSDGAQSLSEMEFKRLCRRFGIAEPAQQTKRRDGEGKLRFTDCEWRLPDGRLLVLEIDGGFHMEVEHWEDDLARQRALSAPDRVIIRCTTREIRDDPERLVRDLRRLGVQRAA